MTQVTPPGWYPDPGQTSDGPATERWWDGNAWTDRIRPAEAAPADAAWGPPAQPPAAGPYAPYPPGPVPPAPGARRGLHTGIAVGVAAVVLGCIGIGTYALTANDGDNSASSSQGPGGQNGQGGPGGQEGPGGQGGQGGPGGGSGGSDGGVPAPGGSAQPQVEDGYAVDSMNGIGIPVPDGWSASALSVGAQITADGAYECPGDTSKSCTPGGAYSAPAEALGLEATTAEAAAKADIEENAEESYGGTTYGKITSHEELVSEAVTVAGQKGYAVRWKVVTQQGADGYVQSLVFPAPADPDRLVVVRFGTDAGSGAPGQAVIDEITEGIKKVSGGGSGQNV
ncbi:DUF2510 domain-containing protein [Streptomyces poonensis]|uniref:Membrane protein n=1 Tax=Streptomyces poonensis TaxID=68255 RepID=A0A918QA22_9ACTN|nr:DUF2510 domain-containing protein [Streptomyces poonensis]GGZ38751.1 membrane protein [Streptomyces poonensis]GLJ92084.1 membrane protein [Streptomyces poonensis]